jgi:ubiquinone biosynthesis protein UbiJ
MMPRDHIRMRELARSLVRDSVIEDVLAQRIAQIIEFIHDEKIIPLQEDVQRLELQVDQLMDRIMELEASHVE